MVLDGRDGFSLYDDQLSREVSLTSRARKLVECAYYARGVKERPLPLHWTEFLAERTKPKFFVGRTFSPCCD